MTDKKTLLIYAHYYVPDVASTGQIIRELAEGMLGWFDITIICVVPSYFGKVEERYKIQRFYRETINNVNIIRIRVPEFTKTDKVSRTKNILAYFLGARKATTMVDHIDYVFSISQPPILGGLLGVYGKRKKHAKFIYNIQDFNPEQIMAVHYSKSRLINNAMMAFDKYSCRNSDLIITVGRDLVETIHKRFAGKKVPKTLLINNWIDENEIYPVEKTHPKLLDFKKKYVLSGKFVIMYSGNIGLYYDLENLFKVIEKFKPGTKTADGREVVFAFIGAGSALDKLVLYKEKQHMDNVVFIPYQDKADLVYSLNAGDVHWVVSAKGIKGVSCPSKYYGVAASSKACLAVLESGSEIRCIIEATSSGLCSEPEDYKRVESNIRWFIDNAGSEELVLMGKRGRDNLLKNLTKCKSVEKYAEEILNM
ncbi:MAG: glycosyltransferase family 4 protein [Clostridium sp.]|nr:glycosyltransferase family 4 protein [Clostridium sp.]